MLVPFRHFSRERGKSFGFTHIDTFGIEVKHQRRLDKAAVNAMLQFYRVGKPRQVDHTIPAGGHGEGLEVNPNFARRHPHQIGVTAMRIEEQETAKPECGRLPNDRRPTFYQCRRPV